MRLAWFSPVPPVRTGIAGRSAELIAALAARGASLDVYSQASPDAERADAAAGHAITGAIGNVTAHSAHDFVWRQAQRPYDLTVYQFGNSSHHDYIWPYALRYPGLVVLHDTRLHHARAALLLRERRADDYRREFAWNHPGVNADLAELAVAGLDSALYYDWPMARTLIASARLVAVHGEGTRLALLDVMQRNGVAPADITDRIVAIRLGDGSTLAEGEARDVRARVRAAYGIPPDAIVFGVFGGLTPEKRIPQVLAAFANVRAHVPDARLLLAGAPAAHYDVHADIAARRLADRVVVAGYLPTETDLAACIAACDVSVNLRWPTARETSGPWLLALAAGVPTIVTDLVHMTGFPSLDPRTWRVNHAGARGAKSEGPPADGDAVCVAVDVLDEDHSLRLAMRRLGTDAPLRERLGRAGHAWWTREHSPAVMVDDYVAAIALAMARPAPVAGLPPHAHDDGDRRLRTLVEPFGIAAALSRDRLLR